MTIERFYILYTGRLHMLTFINSIMTWDRDWGGVRMKTRYAVFDQRNIFYIFFS